MPALPESPVDDRDFRKALGAFATGVCIVTADTSDGPLGLTVNAFSSVSLKPPLVLWCLNETSARWPAFAAADHFAVHVLPADAARLADRFATGICKLAPDEFTTGASGAPLLTEQLVRPISLLECITRQRVQAGDHMVVIGEVERLQTRPGDALTYFRSQYGEARK